MREFAPLRLINSPAPPGSDQARNEGQERRQVRRRPAQVAARQRYAEEHDVPALRGGEDAMRQKHPGVHGAARRGRNSARRQRRKALSAVLAGG